MKAIFGLVIFTLTACATNGYEKYYTPQPKAVELVASPVIDKPPKEPMVVNISEQNSKATITDLRRHGYILIGESSFYGPASKTDNDQAIDQAKKIGAALVTIGISYHDTLSGTNQFTLPGAPVTSTVNTVGNVNGNYYNANSTVTTPGAPTTYNIPYVVDRNNFWAGYWVHQSTDKYKLGALMQDLPPNLTAKLHRNTGVYIPIVIAGTPAFAANILDGDVITKINGMDVIDQASFKNQLAQLSGQPVTLDLIRGDDSLSIKLTLH